MLSINILRIHVNLFPISAKLDYFLGNFINRTVNKPWRFPCSQAPNESFFPFELGGQIIKALLHTKESTKYFYS